MNATYAQGNPAAFKIPRRDIVLYFVLTLVTCGLWGIFWFCTLTDDSNRVSGHPEAMNGVVNLLLVIVTCGLWGLYWAYTVGNRIDEAKAARGIAVSGTGAIYLILFLIGCGWIAELMMQSELNKLAG